LTTGKPIGTGPFTYGSYTPNVEVRLDRWEQYWQAPANFPTVIYAIYSEVTTAHNAFLSYTIDQNAMTADQNLELYDADPKLTVYRFTEETGSPSLVYQYLGFNNNKYNATWRKAFSWAVNYTYVIDELRLGNAFRAVGAISPGFGAAYNASVTAIAPTYNIAAARTAMQSMGFGVGYATDDEWTDHANNLNGKTPFLSVPNTYNIGNQFREDMFVALNNWFKLIGVEVVDDGCEFTQFLTYLNDDMDHLGVYAIGWAPDYLDPYNMLDPLFNPVSGSNSAQVNDTWLNTQMEAALAETDDNLRNDIYKSIQWYMAARGFFHAPLYHSKVLTVHGSNIYGYPYNSMGALRIYPIYRGLYPPF
ncbi:MAG: ABC transporter substrate-binding protein, partial [Candidatus Lokiarchaeota archaeon]|nr:ABC transporter substrate-binding protein [Candidatus Lokiarchaeota archaeon]